MNLTSPIQAKRFSDKVDAVSDGAREEEPIVKTRAAKESLRRHRQRRPQTCKALVVAL